MKSDAGGSNIYSEQHKQSLAYVSAEHLLKTKVQNDKAEIRWDVNIQAQASINKPTQHSDHRQEQNIDVSLSQLTVTLKRCLRSKTLFTPDINMCFCWSNHKWTMLNENRVKIAYPFSIQRQLIFEHIAFMVYSRYSCSKMHLYSQKKTTYFLLAYLILKHCGICCWGTVATQDLYLLTGFILWTVCLVKVKKKVEIKQKMMLSI